MGKKSQVSIKVERLLRDYPKSRSDDRDLLLRYWYSEGLILTPEQRERFMRTTPAESITRSRRNLRGKYPGDKETEEARFNKSKEMSAEYSGMTAEQRLAQLGYKLVD